jgi:hypothetical protein
VAQYRYRGRERGGDILGTGMGAGRTITPMSSASPIHRTPAEECPPGLPTPKTIMDGVHRGNNDGRNQSESPVWLGAIHFDDSYIASPSSFGTGGSCLPGSRRLRMKKGILPERA